MASEVNVKVEEGTEQSNFDVWIGSQLGVLKSADAIKRSFQNHNVLSEVNRSQAITSLAWRGGEEEELFTGLSNGCVKTFSCSSRTYSADVQPYGDSPVRGIISISPDRTVACLENGSLKIWDNSETVFTTEKSIGDNIAQFVSNRESDFAASGGDKNSLKIWDLANFSKPVFVAKNVRNDFLNLEVPVHVSAIDFVGSGSSVVCVGTAHHHVRVYDRRAQRRPVTELEWHEHPVTAISVAPDGASVVCGNSAGYMATISLSTKKPLGYYAGNVGSIRSIKHHASQPIVAACGLDRFIRLYDENTRKLRAEIYMKSNLNCLLMSSEDINFDAGDVRGVGMKRRKDDDVVVVENDDIWEEMEMVQCKAKKKKKFTIVSE